LPVHPTWVRRLPVDFEAPEFGMRRGLAAGGAAVKMPSDGEGAPYGRTEGGLRSRLEGTAIHAFLEHLARLRMRMSVAEVAVAMEDEMPGIVAEIRSHGLALPAAQRLVQEALAVARRTLTDPVGAWMLAPYQNAEAESRWTGLVRAGEADSLRTLRPDRVFLAAAPENLGLENGALVWWIIDYKTSHADSKDGAQQAFLESHRLQHIDQLAAYAQMLRRLKGKDPVLDTAGDAIEIRAGIYYPRLQLFDHWLA
jgi:PD-(D/E)XK nuclease superfamily